ncbi:Unknown protein sequence [Pseudomonas amygdali pv. lachrymans]|uniref:Uncharacterized protein n=1 Tax=Pseudomonas amygdali pv. lachrymans TaxID=53707 RepID=A0ABR5KU41_PSEAV|nr:Unknown protein sequence [Pseudomonas amygdali pv. lachrymans]
MIECRGHFRNVSGLIQKLSNVLSGSPLLLATGISDSIPSQVTAV